MSLNTGMKMIKTETVTVEKCSQDFRQRQSLSIWNSSNAFISRKDSRCALRRTSR